MAKKAMKSFDSFRHWYQDQTVNQKRLIAKLRKIVRTTAPQLTEGSKWSNGVWLKDDLPIIYIHTATDHLQFGFFAGAKIADPKQLLRGNGKSVRHIRIESSKDIDTAAFAAIIRKVVKAPPYRRTAGSNATPSKGKKAASKSESNAKDISTYIRLFPKDVQVVLKKVRGVMKEAAPEADETIAYGIPTLKYGGKNLVHFAGYSQHVGIYPSPSAIEKFSKELAKYKTSKGAVQFPLDQGIPYSLIKKIVKFRLKETLEAIR